ncbi:MAG: RND transporter [Acidobacteria bacterium]|nr:MAG: RND transporter [Acidobacteriota bacterium]REK09537.1 MAG: RND transporter [Acidobacteriota bacterium]
MNTPPLTAGDRFALAWVDRVCARPWMVLLAALALVGAASSGAIRLSFSDSFRDYFGPENPELLAFDELQATYAKSDSILFVVQPSGGDVFTRETLSLIEELTERAWQLPYASRVDSLTNFQHSWAEGDDLTVADLVRDADALSQEELEARREIALAEPLLRGLLVSPEGDTTGVNVVFQFPEVGGSEVAEAVTAARALAEEARQQRPDTRIVLAGVTMLNHAFAESGQRDGATLVPLMFGLVFVLMLVILRSLVAALAGFTVVGMSAATGLGLAGYLGIALSPVAVTAPTLIMTLAVADSVHILVTLLAGLREGSEKVAALRESVRVNFVPVAITSLTTIVGFLSLNFSDAPPFHDLGNITAIGIAAAFLLSLTVLPAMVVLLPIRARAKAGSGEDGWIERFVSWVVRRHRLLLVASGLILLVGVGLVTQLDLDDQWVRYFDDRVEFRGAAEFTDEHLTGLYLVEFSVPSGEAEGIHDPRYLRALDGFTQWLRSQPEVRHVTSYVDIVKRLNQNLHADDPAYSRIPEERELAAQYLLLYELSLPFGLDLNDRIAVDKSATRVTTLLDGDTTTLETRAFLRRAESWLAENAPAEMATRPSGLGVMFAYLSQRNIESMLRGNVTAVLLIVVVLMLALRSVTYGLLSLIPNTVPILLTFAVWQLVAGKVGMAGAMVSATSLGIVVDDTVHFLAKYLRARRERGLDAEAAVRYAFRTVGRAILATTVILAAGFLVLTLSTFRINFELGLLTAIAIALAVVADFTLLPALLLWWGRPRSPQAAPEESAHGDLSRRLAT